MDYVNRDKVKFKSHFSKSSNFTIYMLNIIKKINKDYKKARERYQNLSKEEKDKKATIWS